MHQVMRQRMGDKETVFSQSQASGQPYPSSLLDFLDGLEERPDDAFAPLKSGQRFHV
jgi:hypothetical protein